MPGAIIGAVIGGTTGLVGGLTASGKDKYQMQRDEVRNNLKDALGADDKWQITNADGSTFDIGKDGGAKLQNVGTNVDGKTERHYYDVDWSNPTAKEIVGIINPLVTSKIKDPKLASDTVGMLTNAATAGGKVTGDAAKNNAQALLAKLGGTPSQGDLSKMDPNASAVKFLPVQFQSVLPETITVGQYQDFLQGFNDRDKYLALQDLAVNQGLPQLGAAPMFAQPNNQATIGSLFG